MKRNCLGVGVLLFLALALPARADKGKDIEDYLNEAYKDKIVTLRHFYASNWLRFDKEGNAKEKWETGPWTLLGLIHVSNVKVGETKVKLDGTRILVAFDEKQERSYYRSRERVEVEVDYDPGTSPLVEAHKTLSGVLVTGEHTLADSAPAYWRPFLERNRSLDWPRPPQAPTGEATQPDAETPKRIKVSTGVQEARVVKRVPPKYPLAAKRARIEGQVTFEAVIDKKGNVKGLRVVQARGMGLEEAVAEAVSQWKYEPTTVQGEPVEVVTIIKVIFDLR